MGLMGPGKCGHMCPMHLQDSQHSSFDLEEVPTDPCVSLTTMARVLLYVVARRQHSTDTVEESSIDS